MTFDLDQQINKNFRQILKNYLAVDSLENYDIKIEELRPQDKSRQLFKICFNLTYQLLLLKNNLLAVTAISKTYNNQIFSLTNQNHIKKLYNSNSIDYLTLNFFKTTISKIESKAYSLSISSKTEKNKTFSILFQIKIITSNVKTTQFGEDYLIEYKFNKNKTWYTKLKKYLIESYKEIEAIPTREDAVYKQIENFKPYELTYKIFYQMAIRNENAKKIIYALDYLHDIHTMQKSQIIINTINYSIQNEERLYTIVGTVDIKEPATNKIFIGLNEYKFQCVESIDNKKFKIEVFVDKDINSLDLFLTIGSEKHQDALGLPLASSALKIRSTTTGVSKKNKETTISVKVDKEKHSILPDKEGNWRIEFINSKEILTKEIILQKYQNYLNPEEHQIYLSSSIYFINELIQEFETELIEKYLIYPDNYEVNHPEKKDILFKRASNNSFDIQRFQDDSTYQHENKYFFKQDDYDGYSIYQGILKDEDSRYNLSTIKQDATKQVVDQNVSNFQINLKLPKNELILYLEKLKDNYDNDNSILMSPMELLGIDIGIEPEDIKNMDSIEWADTFYIYDYFKNNEDEKITDKKNGIKVNLTFYYCDLEDSSYENSNLDSKSVKNIKHKYSKKKKSNNKEFHIEIDTIGSRYKLMKVLIEQEKYKSLIN